MKILLLNQTFYPDRVATAQHLTDLAEYLARKGCEVTVLSARRNYENPKHVHLRRECYRGIQIVRASSTGFGKSHFFLRLIDALTFEFSLLFAALRLPRHDVVLSFTSPPLIGFVGLLIALIWRRKSVQWLMDINPDIAYSLRFLDPESPVSKLLTWALEFSLSKSDAVVVLDRCMKEKALQHGVPIERIHVIPPWPVHDYHVESRGYPKENAFRKEHGLSGKFVILYSGNHSIVHPLDTLLEAALRLSDDDRIVFAFIGDGTRVEQVREFTERHSLKNILQLPRQPRERLGESLTFADMHVVVMGDAVNGLVHPSKIYGVLATGRPYVFIGPKNSYVGDVLRECPYGFQVDHSDPEGLVAVICQAMSLSEEELNAYHQNMRYVAEHFSQRRSMEILTRDILGLSLAQDTVPTSPPLHALGTRTAVNR